MAPLQFRLCALSLAGGALGDSSLRGLRSLSECHDAVEGEWCYIAVVWAREHGITGHPDWYPNLTPESPDEAFQSHLHSLGLDGCPQPCAPTEPAVTTASPPETTSEAQQCRRAEEGEDCYQAVQWARQEGIWGHPEWYPDLTPDSPFEGFQAHLHSLGVDGCPQPCAPTEPAVTTASPPETTSEAQQCRRAEEGEDCYQAVQWARQEGIWGHPEWYPDLTPDSPFEGFQAHLHSLGVDGCPQPCAPTEPAVTTASPPETTSEAQQCRRAEEGDQCYQAVQWARQEGIWGHPEWYPDLTPDSPFEGFQAHLHYVNNGLCPAPCGTVEATTTLTEEATVPATTSAMEQGELRSIEMTSYRLSGTDYPDPVSWPSSCSVQVVDDKVCASVQGYANEEDCGFTIKEDGYISTVGGAGFASSGDYVRLLGEIYTAMGPQRVSVTAGTAMDFHSDSFYAGGSITLCFEPQRSIEMTSYKRWGSTYSPAMWPTMGSTCSVKEVDGMVCASVQGYADDEDCGFTINEAGYISTVGPRSFAITGDYVRLLGYAYNTSVPQSVSVTAGTSMDFHSDGEDAGGQITLCFEPEPSQ